MSSHPLRNTANMVQDAATPLSCQLVPSSSKSPSSIYHHHYLLTKQLINGNREKPTLGILLPTLFYFPLSVGGWVGLSCIAAVILPMMHAVNWVSIETAMKPIHWHQNTALVNDGCRNWKHLLSQKPTLKGEHMIWKCIDLFDNSVSITCHHGYHNWHELYSMKTNPL